MKRFLYTISISAAIAVALIVFIHLSNGNKPTVADASASDELVAVDATVYRGLMQMLGIGNRCVDFSNEMKPDAEKIVASGAKMLLLSVYEGVDTAKYQRVGINVVACTDFMETSPLARAVWMKRFGRLWGVQERADSLYDVVETNYKRIKNASLALGSEAEENAEVRPTVMFDMLYGALWYQPSAHSTLGQIVIDAGGALPFGITQEGGSAPLSREQMLAKGKNSSVWIVRYQGENDLTLDDIRQLDPVYSEFRAFKEGNVWGCNTSKVAYFDETAFRPDWLLEEMKTILGGTLSAGNGLRYFKRLETKK